MPVFRFTVNGEPREVDTFDARPLLEVLREDLQLTGTKYGCGEGQCRACTVLIDGAPALSCITPVRSAAGKRITTIEGLARDGRLHPVQQAFAQEGAMQCGYCTPGMILQTVALLEKNPSPARAQILQALNGSLCRCNGYPRIVAAVEFAARLQRSMTAQQEVVHAAE
ncbi:MAG: (2Fe-2S)-binding protein [Bryobacteraceae bacterium]|jgi:aerobic-type carbon monoxide dehydrogenase small subunit (CoxS/CutS family)|nr:MAG: (2Fe-2S)-binding protein [Bryobacteraceae bacterium]